MENEITIMGFSHTERQYGYNDVRKITHVVYVKKERPDYSYGINLDGHEADPDVILKRVIERISKK